MNELQYVRDLAKQYAEIANQPVQEERRKLWQDHYDLKETRPLLFTSNYNVGELFANDPAKCSDEFLRKWEMSFRKRLFDASLDHDEVFNPWITISAVKSCRGKFRWGLPVELGERPMEGHGAAGFKPSLLEEEDFEKLKVPFHKIDEKATREDCNNTLFKR